MSRLAARREMAPLGGLQFRTVGSTQLNLSAPGPSRQQMSVAAQHIVSVPQQPPASQALEVQAATQPPPLHSWPLGQTVPQAPQLAASLWGSEQKPLQQVCFALHAGTHAAPPVVVPEEPPPVVPVVPPPVVVSPPVLVPVLLVEAVLPPVELAPPPVDEAAVPEVELAPLAFPVPAVVPEPPDVPVLEPLVLPALVTPPVDPLLAAVVVPEDVPEVEAPPPVEVPAVETAAPVEDSPEEDVLEEVPMLALEFEQAQNTRLAVPRRAFNADFISFSSRERQTRRSYPEFILPPRAGPRQPRTPTTD
jgi:hypothetical protein